MAEPVMTTKEKEIAQSIDIEQVYESYRTDNSIKLTANGKDNRWWIPNTLQDYTYMSKTMRIKYAKRFLRVARHQDQERDLLSAAKDAIDKLRAMSFLNVARGITYCLEGDLDFSGDEDWSLVEQLNQIRYLEGIAELSQARALQKTCVGYLGLYQDTLVERQEYFFAIAYYLYNIEQYVEPIPIPMPDDLVHQPNYREGDLVVYYDGAKQLHIGTIRAVGEKLLIVTSLPNSQDYCELTTVTGSKRNGFSSASIKYVYGYATDDARVATEPVDIRRTTPWRTVEYYQEFPEALRQHYLSGITFYNIRDNNSTILKCLYDYFNR